MIQWEPISVCQYFFMIAISIGLSSGSIRLDYIFTETFVLFHQWISSWLCVPSISFSDVSVCDLCESGGFLGGTTRVASVSAPVCRRPRAAQRERVARRRDREIICRRERGSHEYRVRWTQSSLQNCKGCWGLMFSMSTMTSKLGQASRPNFKWPKMMF